jgi:hypothetical protein
MGEIGKALSGLTVKSIVLGVILALFNLLIMSVQGVASAFWIAPWNVADNTYGETASWGRLLPRIFMPLGILVLAFVVIYLINKSRPGTFTLQEAATVFMIVFAAGYMSYDMGLYGTGDVKYSTTTFNIGILRYSSGEKQAELWAMLPSVWAGEQVTNYTYTNINSVQTGSWSVYWPFWSGVMTWRWIYNLGNIFMFIGIATLLRRQLVEVEALGFPFATLATEVVQISQPAGTKIGNILKNKWFLIGLVVMLLWGIIPMGGWAFTQRGNIEARNEMLKWMNPYRQPAWVPGTIYPLLETAGNFAYNLWPFFIGWCYLWPIGELAGGLVGAGIHFTWMATAFSTGIQWIYQGKYTGDWGSSIDSPIQLLLDRWFGVVFGFMLALFVIPAIRHRNLVIQQIKSIFEEPDDPDKPVSYKTIWLILLLGFVLLVAAGVMIGINAGAWALFIIIYGVLSIALMRVVCANGGHFFLSWKTYWDGAWYSYIGLAVVIAFGLAPGKNWETLISAYMMIEGDISRVLWGGLISAVLLLALYKMGKLTKVKEKTVLVGTTIGLCISAIMVLVFSAMLQSALAVDLSWSQGWGGLHIDQIWGGMRDAELGLDGFTSRAGMVGNEVIQAPEYFAIAVVIGFAIIAVFSLLQQRYTWFVISVTGVFTGAMWGSELWLPMIVAIVAKYLTLRIGGTQKYEDTGKPLAVGFLAGAAIAYALMATTSFFNRVAVGADYPA